MVNLDFPLHDMLILAYLKYYDLFTQVTVEQKKAEITSAFF